MFKLWINILLLVGFMGMACSGQRVLDHAVLWQGSEFSWSFPQIWVGFGSRIESINAFNQKSEVRLANRAMAGKQKDVANFETRFASVVETGCSFIHGEGTLNFRGKKGAIINAEQKISFPLPSNFPAEHLYTVLLNGFEFFTSQSPDKLQTIAISVGDGTLDPITKTVTFDIFGSLQIGGSGLINSSFEADIIVSYCLIAGKYTSSQTSFQRNYYWARKEKLDVQNRRVLLSCDSNSTMPVGLAAYKKISLTLDKPHTITGFSTILDTEIYDPKKGKLAVVPKLIFTQWDDTKSDKSINKKEGLAIFDVEMLCVQFPGGCITQYNQLGEIHWRPEPERGNYAIIFPITINCNSD